MKRILSIIVLLTFLTGCAKSVKVEAPRFVPPTPPVSIEQTVQFIVSSDMPADVKERTIFKLLEEWRQMYAMEIQRASEQGSNIRLIASQIITAALTFVAGWGVGR